MQRKDISLLKDDNEIWIFPECDDVLGCIEIVIAEP
jgi:hypothetical protein